MQKFLDVGCGKGFMLYDFKVNFPKLKLYGIDKYQNMPLKMVSKKVKKKVI